MTATKNKLFTIELVFLDLVSFVMHSVFDDFQHFVGRDVVFTHVVEEFLVVGLSLLCLDLLELSFELFDLVFFLLDLRLDGLDLRFVICRSSPSFTPVLARIINN